MAYDRRFIETKKERKEENYTIKIILILILTIIVMILL